MTIPAPLAPADDGAPDPRQKKRLVMGVSVWAIGAAFSWSMIPVVNGSGLASGLKATLAGILLLGAPKIFLLLAIAIMGKPGFSYLKGLLGGHFRRLAPVATVGVVRYRIGLVMFIGLIVLGSLGPYVAFDEWTALQAHRRWLALAGDVLLLASLFILGGDFWDKLRSLFVREAKAVFPPR